MRVGLTGGVGSGKSAVGVMLAQRGAIVIDADVVAREVVEPGTTGLAALVTRFGAGVLLEDGSLNRAALADVVFADARALADLNAITHPLVRERALLLLDAVPADRIAVFEIPLLAEGGPVQPSDFDVVIAVETAMPIRLARLAARGLPETQAQARIAAQATDEQRREIAHDVVLNNGTMEGLAGRVDELWARLQATARQSARPSAG